MGDRDWLRKERGWLDPLLHFGKKRENACASILIEKPKTLRPRAQTKGKGRGDRSGGKTLHPRRTDEKKSYMREGSAEKGKNGRKVHREENRREGGRPNAISEQAVSELIVRGR